jgi:tetratricopeptide (TPR) repeat protein
MSDPLCSAAVLVVAATVQVAAQSPNRNDYVAAVRAYVAGEDLTKKLIPLATWQDRDFDDAVRALVVTKDRPTIEAAAVFQLEVSIGVVGRSLNAAAKHLEFGEQLLRGVMPTPSERRENPESWTAYLEFASMWLGVAGSVFLQESDIARAEPWIDRAVRAGRASAHLKTLAGALAQLKASTLHPERFLSGNGQTRLRTERHRLLLQAKDLFEEALALDGAYAPAYLHLGRVLFLIGDLPRARAAIDRALALAKDRGQQYLAHLFLGAILQEQKDVAGARQAYERALSLIPAAQTATVALAYLELISGRPDRAQAIVDQFALSGAEDANWWAYGNGGLDMAGLAWLREKVRK